MSRVKNQVAGRRHWLNPGAGRERWEREKERRRKRLWPIFQVEQWASGCDKSKDVETANDIPWDSGHTNCVMIGSLTDTSESCLHYFHDKQCIQCIFGEGKRVN